jgi:hypothetical protein
VVIPAAEHLDMRSLSSGVALEGIGGRGDKSPTDGAQVVAVRTAKGAIVLVAAERRD